MNRTFHSILAVYFVLLASGISISSHFCGGNEVSRALLVEAKSCGHHQQTEHCKAGEEHQKGCCSTTFDQIKIQDNYIATGAQQLAAAPLLLLPTPVQPAEQPVAGYLSLKHFQNTGPPPLAAPERLALVQQYLL